MTTKIAVSLPDAEVETARRAVASGRAPSVSAYIAEAIARRERQESLTELLDDLDRELGEPTASDYAWADKALGLG
jgi:antitoxin ParD1/3/4